MRFWLFIIILNIFPNLLNKVLGQQSDLSLINQYIAISDSLGELGDYKNAVLFRKKALNLQQVQIPVPYEQLVSNYRTLGYFYRRWGQYEESFFFEKKAVRLAELQLNDKHPELAKAYNGLGGYYFGRHQYELAQQYFNKALKISLSSNSDEIGDFYNNVGIAQQALGDSEAAMATYRLALGHNLTTLGFYNKKTADNFDNLGTLYYNLNQFENAILHLDSAEMILDSLYPPNSANFAGLYNNKGAVYNSMGNHRSALDYLERSLKIYERYGSGKHPETANIYANIGLLLQDKGDWDKAISYFGKALSIRESNFGANNPKVGRTLLYMGNCFLEKLDYERAFEYYQKSLSVFKKLKNIAPSEIADVRNGLGNYYEKIGNLNEALHQYEEALKINAQKLNTNDPDVANSYARIGKVHLARKEYEEAYAFFEKAKNIRLNIYGNKHAEVADAFALLAIACHLDEVCFEEFISQAYQAINFDQTQENEFEKVYSPIVLLRIFQTHGSWLYDQFLRNEKLNYLESADQILGKAISLINFIKTSLEQPGSRLALQDNFYLIYEKAILVKNELKEATNQVEYWEEAFQISEQSNAILLMEAIRSVDAERFAGIPDSLLDLERQYKTDLSFLEKLRFEEELKNESGDPRILKQVNDRIFQLYERQHELSNYFKEHHEEYFKMQYEPKIVSIEKIQNQLIRPDQTMISYFVGEDNLFAFVVSKNQFELIHIDKDFPLEIWVEEFRNSIYKFNPADSNAAYLNQKLANIGYELYQLIFEPIADKIATNSLIIVPGGTLGYLPFDALLSEPTEFYNNFESFKFLINKYSISYSYSATLLDEMKKGHHRKSPFIAFAPVYYGDTLNVSRSNDPWRAVLGQLRFNVQEATQIHEMMGGQLFLDSMATEENFMKYAPKAGILHLATHGKSNDQHGDYSYLAFYQTADSIENELLFVKNLYNMRIPASLVVLSACETGIGELQRGEGIVSLARGFSYAGAASIVTTLWSIDDNASANIMVDFYKYMKEGKPKDVALRESKLAYMQSNIGNNRMHPLFWAAFVPVGDMESIISGWPWWSFIIIAIAFVPVFWLYKTREIKFSDRKILQKEL